MTHWLKEAPPYVVFGGAVAVSTVISWTLTLAIGNGLDARIDRMQVKVQANEDKLFYHATQHPHLIPTKEKP